MHDEIVKHVLPALRMLASRENILNIRLDNSEAIISLEDEQELRDLPFILDDSTILVVDETTNPTEIISDLPSISSNWAALGARATSPIPLIHT